MATETLIIVVGGDYLAYEICREILKTAGQRVVLVWKHEDERAQRLLSTVVSTLKQTYPETFSFCNSDPADSAALLAAGLRPPGESPNAQFAIVAVSQDDRLNLRVSLLARDINERVRVTIRQFNPVLGHKIQEGLQYNCTAISPAAHAAATYAASAVDPSCFYALPFPTLETMVTRAVHRIDVALDVSERGVNSAGLFGFCERTAREFGVADMAIEEAEGKLHSRIIAVDGVAPHLCYGNEDAGNTDLINTPLHPDARIVVFGPMVHLKETWPTAPLWRPRYGWRQRLARTIKDFQISLRRTEPILRAVFLAAIVFFALFVAFFAWNLHLNVLTSMYYVMSTMTTVGYGDISPCKNCGAHPLSSAETLGLMGAILAMLVGIVAFAVLTATITAALNAATTRRLQGLRNIHRSGHVIVCGAGNVGSLVVDYLRELGENVVVVERNPDAILIELARDRKVDLLTGDATNDETIGYCNPERAKALIGVTNSDTANLEAALGARTRIRQRGKGDIHVVLRIDDLAFGASIKRHFGIASFSTTELTVPTIAGLARFESTRGRFNIFAGSKFERTFQLAERLQGPENVPPPSPPERPGYKVQWIPLFVWRERRGRGVALPVHKFGGDVRPGDRLLFMVPLDQFSDWLG